jgi:hypothetical protein
LCHLVKKYGVNFISTAENPIEYNYGPRSVAVGDLNNDNCLDMVVANHIVNNIDIFFGYDNGSFANQMAYSTDSFPQSVAVGDFNNDTRLDIVVTNWGANSVSVLLGYGNGTFANQMTYPTGDGPSSVAVGDYNNDNRLDIIVNNKYSNNVAVLIQYDRGALADEMTYASGGDSRLRYVVVNDMNSDGRLNIVVANYGTNNVGVLLGYGNGTFESQIMLNIGSNSHPTSIAVADFNGDSQMDIVVTISATKNVDILLGNGKGIFSIQTS